jgi:hypothetical protein
MKMTLKNENDDRKMANMAREIFELRKVVFYHHYQGCGGCTMCIDYIQALGNDLSEFLLISPRKVQRHETIGKYREDKRNILCSIPAQIHGRLKQDGACISQLVSDLLIKFYKQVDNDKNEKRKRENDD